MNDSAKESPADEDAEISSILEEQVAKTAPELALLAKQARLLRQLQRDAMLESQDDPPASEDASTCLRPALQGRLK